MGLCVCLSGKCYDLLCSPAHSKGLFSLRHFLIREYGLCLICLEPLYLQMHSIAALPPYIKTDKGFVSACWRNILVLRVPHGVVCLFLVSEML
jgi:hypothetical protein